MSEDSGSGPDQITKNFGLVIAYLVPGFIGIWGLSYFDTEISKWISRAVASSTSIGDFLLLTVASAGMGVFLQGVRNVAFECGIWRIPFFGVGKPKAFDKRPAPGATDRQAVEDHYRFYQFYSNTFFAAILVFVGSLQASTAKMHLFWRWLAFVAIEALLLYSSCDTIVKFRRKSDIWVDPKKDHPKKKESRFA